MARTLLGRPVDVHGGGSDLLFPHHESELAQAEGVPGGAPFVRQWVHTGTVHMSGEKMSKSLGNMAFVDDLITRHHPAALRAFLLRHHYRSDWHFDERELAGPPPEPGEGPADRESFHRALQDDLDTPEALRILDRAAALGDADSRAVVAEGRALLGLDLNLSGR